MSPKLTWDSRGAKLHKSTKDTDEQTEVVTDSIHTEKGTRLESGHAREDGTSTKHGSREELVEYGQGPAQAPCEYLKFPLC